MSLFRYALRNLWNSKSYKGAIFDKLGSHSKAIEYYTK